MKFIKKIYHLIHSINLFMTIAEKIRYETLGGKMLKELKKILKKIINQKLILKEKINLKTKDDVMLLKHLSYICLKIFIILN